jgi:hypothetical protein
VSVTREDDVLVVSLANGWTRKTEPKKHPENSREWALFHGNTQRIRDSVASLSKELQFEKAQEEINAVIDALESGQIRRERAASLGFNRDDVIAGLMKVNKIDREAAEKVVATATVEKIREVITKRPDFKAAIAEAQTARLKAEAKASPVATGSITF